MKRIIVALLTVIFIIGVTGCGEKKIEFEKTSWNGITFEVPSSLELDENVSNEDTAYYKMYNQDNDIQHMLYVARVDMGAAIIDGDALDEVVFGMHDTEGVSDTTNPSEATINDGIARKTQYIQEVDGIDFNVMVYIFPVDTYVVAFCFATQGTDFEGFQRSVDSITFDNASAVAPDTPTPNPEPEETPKPQDESKPSMTQGESNALETAESYLSTMPFPHSGLISQLEYEGYTTAEATYAADNCGANWNEQAAKAAQEYIDLMSFSRQGLIDQLIYEGYTPEQAEYGASAVGY